MNQRLVAKMLTQSYKDDVAGGFQVDYLGDNPRNIAQDPEFLQLNPEFLEFQNGAGPAGLLQPLGNSDAFRQLWSWVTSDENARAFLNGTADEWGMEVNKYYLALDIPDDTLLDSLPKADQSTYRAPDAPDSVQAYGTFELRPYVGDMYESAVRTRRADAGTKIVWDQSRNPPAFVSSGAQSPGTRFIMGITDIASAERLKLPMARLVNGAGEAVEPTPESITIAIDNFTESSVSGVATFNPTIDVEGAYPLATVAYAAVSVCDATLGQLAMYNKLLTLAKGKGQNLGSERGQLPEGYVPLSADQKSTLGSMIAAIKAEIASPVCSNHSSSSTYVPPLVDSGVTTPSTDGVTDPVEEQAAGTFGAGSNNALKYSLLSALFFGAPFIAGGRALVRKANAIHD